MTVDDKRNAIEKHCENSTCGSCKLRGEVQCYYDAADEVINENYAILFGDTSTVNHPSHYNQGGIECIDAMVSAFGKDAVENFCLVNAFKYVWRSRDKNGFEDIDKAIWYLNKVKELNSSE